MIDHSRSIVDHSSGIVGVSCIIGISRISRVIDIGCVVGIIGCIMRITSRVIGITGSSCISIGCIMGVINSSWVIGIIGMGCNRII